MRQPVGVSAADLSDWASLRSARYPRQTRRRRLARLESNVAVGGVVHDYILAA
jgi:hypothetical protein